MPDSSGKIRGISIPSVPWHGLSDAEKAIRDADQMLWDKQTETPQDKYDEGLRDADRMLWDKQTKP